MIALLPNPSASAPQADMESLYELVVGGGPLMVPIAACSIVALAFAVERWVRLQPAVVGSKRLARDVVEATEARGAAGGLEVCRASERPLTRILGAGLERADSPFAEREKVVEDIAAGEVRRMGRNLRPLFLVWLIAPLLGLLGTVWGMIKAFSNIATQEGLGRPELLADGIYTALTTTAAGLAVAIPAMFFYWVLQGRIEKFAARAEDTYRSLDAALAGGRGASGAGVAAPRGGE